MKKIRNYKKLNRSLKKVTIVLAVFVLLLSSYAMALPAMTLDEQKAAEEAGIILEDEVTQEELFEEASIEIEEDQLLLNEEEISEEVLIETKENGEEEAGEERPFFFFDDSTDLIVSVEAPYGAFEEGTVMMVSEITSEEVFDTVNEAVEDQVMKVEAVDICFYYEDEEVEPMKAIKVSLSSAMIMENQDAKVVHIDNNGDAKIMEQSDEIFGDDEIIFESDAFSVYAVVYTETIEKDVLTSDGATYRVSVSYNEDAGIAADAFLSVEEIFDEAYISRSEESLGIEEGSSAYVRLFDISIFSSSGEKIIIAAPVSVNIELIDEADRDLKVVHFENEKDASVIASVEREVTDEGLALSFETDGFSVYAVVEAPDLMDSAGWSKVSSLEELASRGRYGLYISHLDRYFFTSDTYKVNNTSRTGIKKTSNTSAHRDDDGKIRYYFEKTENENEYYVYCLGGSGRQYIAQSGNSLYFTDENSRQAFLVSSSVKDGSICFQFRGDGYYWNMQGGANGKGFAAYDKANDVNNNMSLWYNDGIVEDPYLLDGRSFVILQNDETILGKALMAENCDASSLKVRELPILDMKDRSRLYVDSSNESSEWTFEYSGDGFEYYISSMVNGEEKYLAISNDKAYLSDTKGIDTKISLTAGLGENEGKYEFSVGSGKLSLYNVSGSRRYVVSQQSSTETMLNLMETKTMTADDLMIYTAQKVSVSDENRVHNGSQVVIYTRVWNEQTLRYEFYALDHDGGLIRAYESGDSIQWVEDSVNTMLWDFTEYYNSDGTVNHYYELQNSQYGNYIAPQIRNGQILSDHTIGINLNGRKYGYDYTSIVAWDEENYRYAAMKVENENGIYRLVPSALADAQDFYFAIIRERDPGHLTAVDTIDNDDFGIRMKMIDFNNKITDNRDSVQTAFFGTRDLDRAGMVSTHLAADGYPLTTALTGHEVSLSQLYKASELKSVDHLFIESTYYESGYFEFDSTRNYAYLGNNTDFTVYEQLGTVSADSHAISARHGQFFPYAPIIDPKTGEPYPYSKTYSNTTTTTNEDLSVDDPRYGEPMHEIPHDPKANYFFGMELEASFTQTESGLDAWGHDIIFEFSGDDDFWLYVDGELILDLGGVHSAMTGTVNFRTGIVQSSRGDSTLYQLFRKHYQQRGMSESEMQEKLTSIFQVNSSGQYVFRDYTTHTMRMFYMERGAGASNLHMRFNLAAVKPGTVILSKKLSGTDSPANDLIEFPYQIHIIDVNGEDRILNEREYPHSVRFEGSSQDLPYRPFFSPAGSEKSYEDVYFLKPGQSAEISLPDETVTYYVVECGVDSDVYDQVRANGIALHGAYASGSRRDFATDARSQEECSKVEFDNHVREGAMRTLTLHKKLYDSDGERILSYPDVDTMFSFRLYLGSENADMDSLPLANMYSYFVKDADGNYCRWDAMQQDFVSMDIQDYDVLKSYLNGLSNQEKETIIFKTSMNGSVSNIPASYAVEIHDLIVSVKWKAEERNNEIPKGYTRREEDGYVRIDTDLISHDPISGVIAINEDPEIEIRNQIGWGLTVEKVWSDRDFMSEYDPIYFAVYLEGELISDSIRQLKSGESEIYYFFKDLYNGTDTAHRFSDYIVKEVMVKDPVVNGEGIVTSCSSISILEEGDRMDITARTIGSAYAEKVSYKVSYQIGESTGKNKNIRTDVVKNSRPGISLYKTDWEGKVLEGAVFTLRYENGTDAAAASYRSKEDGLITRAYLSAGTYLLKEIASPKGYVSLPEEIRIKVALDGSVKVSGPVDYYEVSEKEDDEMQAVIWIRNKEAGLKVIKTDASTCEALEGVEFALFRQVIGVDGQAMADFVPMQGYESLLTDENGTVEKIDLNLASGTYYLRESRSLDGYESLNEDLCFSINIDGTVTVNNESSAWEFSNESDGDLTSYMITIFNTPYQKVSFKKVDIADTNKALEGAEFELYSIEDEDVPLAVMVSNEEGILEDEEENSEFVLSSGSYQLVETKAPDGYLINTEAITITVSGKGITYDEGTTISSSNQGISYADGVYSLLITNSSGTVLPHTGGTGSGIFRVSGVLLICISALIYRKEKKKKNTTV